MDERDIEILRSSRRTVAIEIRPDGRVLVRAPKRMPLRDIRQFVADKSGWIDKHTEQMRQRAAQMRETGPGLGPEELRQLTEEARLTIPRRVEHYAPAVGVTYGRISIRHQVSRWGSCSTKGNLNFNCLLMLCPPEVLDYVVVHELCHRKHPDHSPRFWAEVSRVLPDWAERRRWLKENGAVLIERMRSAQQGSAASK